MRSIEDTSTRLLACAPLEIVSDRRSQTLLRAALVIVLLALAAVAGLRLHSGSAQSVARIADMQQQNAALEGEIASLRAELELERATRIALEQQVSDLTAQASELASQLNFLKSRGGRSRD